MKKIIFTTTFILLSIINIQAQQCTTRSGLANFYSKIQQKDSVCVAYFGGSITAQPGWRVQSLNYLKERFPNTVFKEHNATIGGTGSDLGVLRMDYDILRVKPDLMFVEFAVNDSKTDSLVVVNSMEGIVRKLWAQYPDCDICFVYTFHIDTMDELLEGRLNKSARVMERVAEHYGIPSIHLGEDALKMIKNGEMKLKPEKGVQTKVSGNELNKSFEPKREINGEMYFSPDGVHPFLNTGHVLYTKALIRGLESIEKQNHVAKEHKLKKPLSKTNTSNSKTIILEDVILDTTWQKLEPTRQFARNFPSFYKAKNGSTLNFTFKGSKLIAYDLIGPGSCKLSVTIDGQTSTYNRMDGYCTYWRLASVVLAKDLDPKKTHTVSIKVEPLEDAPSILFDHNRSDAEKNPDKYDGCEWYLGNFFVVGEAK